VIVQLALLAMFQQTVPSPAPAKAYLFFMALEGSDEVALLRFDAKGLRVEHRTPFGPLPGEPESPTELYRSDVSAPTFPALSGRTVLLSSAHGFAPGTLSPGPRQVTLSPDGRWYYVTTVHGFPSGMLLKVRIAADSSTITQPPDTVRAQEQLAGEPDGVAVSPDGVLAWVTAAARTGAERSGVSIVYLSSMIEAGHVPTCGGALGSRLTADGARHYSVCAVDDALVEIDAAAMKVSRQLPLTSADRRRCGPSALTMVPDGARIFVACRQSGEVLEVNARSWSVARRLAVAGGPAALAVTSDGAKLVVVARSGGAISLLDVVADGGSPGPVQFTPNFRYAYVTAPGTGRTDIFDMTAMLVASAGFGAPLPALQGVPAAAATSSDGRYGFVTTARSDLEPGTVAVIDLTSRRIVASLDFGRRPAGIAFWKVVP